MARLVRVLPAMQTVMYVGCPDACHEQEQLESEGVCGDVEEGPAVWNSLQNAIQRVEGQAGKGRQAVLLVVFMMNIVIPPAPDLHEISAVHYAM